MIALRFDGIEFMVVDDDRLMRELVAGMLVSFGAPSVRQASDGGEALVDIRRKCPDVLLTDWNMGSLDGLELARLIRRDQDSPDPFLPIIMMSAFAERHRVMAARNAGVNEFLVKPVSGRALHGRVAAVVNRPRPYVRTSTFFGPDRRYRARPWSGEDRRRLALAPEAHAMMNQIEVNDLFNPA